MTADPDPSRLEHLLSRAGRVRSLARALCADPSGAEDLAQDALVAAIEHPPARASASSAWIARVISNLSIDRRRAEDARRERERRASRAEAQPSASELVERAEVQRKLVECVLALPEPYRATLLERWFEEKSPDEIARRWRIPASTVRTRLARGLALLRERLERAEGRAWLAVIAPLAVETRSAPFAAPAALSGGALVSTGVKVSIGVAALAAATFFAWPLLEEEPSRPPIAAEAARPALEPVPRVEANAEERSAVATPAERVPLAAIAPPIATGEPLGEPTEAECAQMEETVPASTLAGIVLRGRDPVGRGTAYLRRGVRFVPANPEKPWIGVPTALPQPGEEELWRRRLGADGRFAFHGLSPDWYTLAIDVGHGTCRQMTFNPMTGSRPARTVVIVLGTGEISGHVYDDQGAPIAEARVVATLEVVRNQHLRTFSCVGWTGRRGEYALGELPAGTYRIGMRRDGRARYPTDDETLEATLPVGGRKVVDFGRRRRLPVWAGVVRARTGEPARGGGRIHLERTGEGRQLDVLYDATGAFRIALLPGRYAARIRAVGDPQRLLDLGQVDVLERGVQRDLVLPGTRLRGIAIDAATVAPWALDMEESISLRPLGQDYPAAITSARIGPGGEFVFDGLGPGTWVVQAWPHALQGVAKGKIEVTILPDEIEVPLTVTIAQRQ